MQWAPTASASRRPPLTPRERATTLLHEGRIRSIDEVVSSLRAVTADDILRVAQRVIRPGNLAAAVVGPYEDGEALAALAAI